MRCLVIGATGYVGTRLVPRLVDAGHDVTCLVRDPAKAEKAGWADRVDVVVGDMTDADAVARACAGVDAAYYLVHQMDGPGFAGRDRAAAEVLAVAAARAGVRRIVYLGGLQPPGETSSTHLASRREVGEVLLAGPVPVAVLQAGIVVGAGSASFEMIRGLAEAVPLPVFPLPDRAWNRVQPIGIDDVLHHLLTCLDLPPEGSGTFDVGGPDVLTYRELISGYATAAGLPRPLHLPVPVAASRLAARAVQALTPVDRHLAAPLIESLALDLVCTLDPPGPPPPGGPTPYAEAVRRALAGEGAAGFAPTDPAPAVLVSEHRRHVDADPAAVWDVVSGVGGDAGWYTVPGAWELRGALDRLIGGVGARRTVPRRLEAGAALDWWRIEDVDPGRSLRLRAEMKLPGVAVLEMRVEPAGAGATYVQRVTFAPQGLAGRAYWYAQLPAHEFLFSVMARTIAATARNRHVTAGSTSVLRTDG